MPRAENVAARESNEWKQTIKSQDRELELIGLEIHDGLAQPISSAIRELDTLKDSVSGQTRQRILRSTKLLRQVLSETRILAYRLRPASLETLGLVKTLESKIHDLEETGVVVHFDADPDYLPQKIDISLYRIMSEALYNVAKHSNATSVWVELHPTKTSIVGSVKDNGVGFDPKLIAKREPTQRGNLGLAAMRVRAMVLGGECEITSTPGRGTEVRFNVPQPEPSW